MRMEVWRRSKHLVPLWDVSMLIGTRHVLTLSYIVLLLPFPSTLLLAGCL